MSFGKFRQGRSYLSAPCKKFQFKLKKIFEILHLIYVVYAFLNFIYDDKSNIIYQVQFMWERIRKIFLKFYLILNIYKYPISQNSLDHPIITAFNHCPWLFQINSYVRPLADMYINLRTPTTSLSLCQSFIKIDQFLCESSVSCLSPLSHNHFHFVLGGTWYSIQPPQAPLHHTED